MLADRQFLAVQMLENNVGTHQLNHIHTRASYIVFAVTTPLSYFVLFQPKTANFCALRAFFINITQH